MKFRKNEGDPKTLLKKKIVKKQVDQSIKTPLVIYRCEP